MRVWFNTIMLIDYHIHTKASFDCFESATAMCEAALKRGLSAVAFTDHIDILPAHPFDWQTDLEAAFHDIDQAVARFGDMLDIVRGIEIGQPQFNVSQAQLLHDRFKVDFIIASIHYLDPDYDMGMSGVADRDPHELFETYLEMVRQMATDADYDVLGHLTYPWRYFKRERDYDFQAEDFTDQFIDIFDIVISRGKGIEVNTSGLRQALAETLPNEQILRLYRSRGGELITIGSDAHTPAHVGGGVAEATEMVARIGFSVVATFRDRVATIHPLGR